MGRFHRHDDGTVHEHDHEHDLGDHSAYATGRERMDVLERIFDENDRTAAANRADLARNEVCAINLMSSPGAGKTTLLVETLRRLGDSVRVGVIVGDIETNSASTSRATYTAGRRRCSRVSTSSSGTSTTVGACAAFASQAAQMISEGAGAASSRAGCIAVSVLSVRPCGPLGGIVAAAVVDLRGGYTSKQSSRWRRVKKVPTAPAHAGVRRSGFVVCV